MELYGIIEVNKNEETSAFYRNRFTVIPETSRIKAKSRLGDSFQNI